jgi:hypothetical protein
MNPFAALWLEEGFELIWRKYGRVYQSFDGIRHFSISLMNLETGSSEFPKDYRRPGQFISIKEDRLWERMIQRNNHIRHCWLLAVSQCLWVWP